jgi:hypothetical protein
LVRIVVLAFFSANLKLPPGTSKSNQFTTFYLFLLWIDTSPRLFNYVCIRAGPVLTRIRRPR